MNLWKDDIGRVRSGWVVLVFALIAALIEGGGALVLALLHLSPGPTLAHPALFLFTTLSLVAGLVATLVCRLAFGERTGLEHARPGRPLWRGIATGLAVFTGVALGLVAGGGASLAWNGSEVRWGALALEACILAPAAFGEELLLRGLAFQALRRGLGDVATVLSTGLLFGALHLLNPNASWTAAAIIALVGFWFGAAMIRSHSTWFPMGLHLAWNFAQGQVFGFPVSGTPAGQSLFRSTATGPGFWSGGAFGPEAAGFTALVLAVACAVTIWKRPAS